MTKKIKAKQRRAKKISKILLQEAAKLHKDNQGAGFGVTEDTLLGTRLERRHPRVFRWFHRLQTLLVNEPPRKAERDFLVLHQIFWNSSRGKKALLKLCKRVVWEEK